MCLGVAFPPDRRHLPEAVFLKKDHPSSPRTLGGGADFQGGDLDPGHSTTSSLTVTRRQRQFLLGAQQPVNLPSTVLCHILTS